MKLEVKINFMKIEVRSKRFEVGTKKLGRK